MINHKEGNDRDSERKNRLGSGVGSLSHGNGGADVSLSCADPSAFVRITLLGKPKTSPLIQNHASKSLVAEKPLEESGVKGRWA